MRIYTYIYIKFMKKFVCFVSLFLSQIGPKRCCPIRLQDFKSNIYLKQSNEIIHFFTCWYQKLKVDRKILGWVWSEMVVATLVTRWMDLLKKNFFFYKYFTFKFQNMVGSEKWTWVRVSRLNSTLGFWPHIRLA